VLAALGRPRSTERLTCFSYVHGPPKRGSDAELAALLAARCRVEHRVVEAYRGDLPAALAANAELGAGVANFCDEVDAWRELAQSPRADVFVGDECFGWVDAPLASREDVLEVVGIRGWDAVEWLGRLLPSASTARTSSTSTSASRTC
jgi:hypothetical protein